MRVEVCFSLGNDDSEAADEASFTWETGSLPLPRQGDQIALGELVTTVESVTFSCLDTGYHETEKVELHLALRLGKREREAGYRPAEFHSILSQLPSVSALHVTGAYE